MPNHPALDALARLPRKKDGKVLIGALNRLVPTYANDHGLAVMAWNICHVRRQFFAGGFP